MLSLSPEAVVSERQEAETSNVVHLAGCRNSNVVEIHERSSVLVRRIVCLNKKPPLLFISPKSVA
jgi:hypothetical protein